jgi:hypothetical protein
MPSPTTPLEKAFRDLVHAIVSGDAGKAAKLLDDSTALAHARCDVDAILLEAGARPEDKDGNGKTVRDAATADRMRAFF